MDFIELLLWKAQVLLVEISLKYNVQGDSKTQDSTDHWSESCFGCLGSLAWFILDSVDDLENINAVAFENLTLRDWM